MTDRLRAAAQAALKFAEFCWRDVPMNEFAFQECEQTIDVLRAALAEAASDSSSRVGSAEPYIWYADDTGDTWTPEAVAGGYAPSDLRPLYTLPPRREWQGLTDEEIDRVTDAQWARGANKPIYAAHRAYARAIEAALKERNA